VEGSAAKCCHCEQVERGLLLAMTVSQRWWPPTLPLILPVLASTRMQGERIEGRQFFKSPSFARQATALDAWEEVDALKQRLVADPTIGDVIKGTMGLRKIRMPLPGRGARGGGRVIYFQIVAPATILLLALYAKNEQEDLDQDDKKALDQLCRLMCRQLNLNRTTQ
jgi:hypothetical protein